MQTTAQIDDSNPYIPGLQIESWSCRPTQPPQQSDIVTDGGCPWMKHRKRGPCMTIEYWFHDIKAVLDCRPGLLRSKAECILEPWVTDGWEGPHLHRCLIRRGEEESQDVPKFCQCAEGVRCVSSGCVKG